MIVENVIDILKKADEKTLKYLINKINTDGIVSDEDESLISSYMVEKWTEECDLFLTVNGYHGSSLTKHGKYFDSHGAVYVLFDADLHSIPEVTAYMDKHVKNYAH